MVLDLAELDPLQRIRLKQLPEEVLSRLRDVIGHVEGAVLDHLEERGDELSVEGKRPDEQGIEDDSAAPGIDISSTVLFAHDNLRGRIVRRPAGGLEEPPILHQVRETEIADLNRIRFVDEDVLGFEVAVGDQVMMAVFDTANDLAEVLQRILLGQLAGY